MAALGCTDTSGVAVLKDCQEPALGRFALTLLRLQHTLISLIASTCMCGARVGAWVDAWVGAWVSAGVGAWVCASLGAAMS